MRTNGKIFSPGKDVLEKAVHVSIPVVLDIMTLLDHVLNSSVAFDPSGSLAKVFPIVISGDKSDRRIDYREINLRQSVFALKRYLNAAQTPICIPASLVRALSLVYAKQLSFLETSICSAIARFDKLHDPTMSVPRSVAAPSSRKRRVVETPLAVVPEDALLLDGTSLEFELPENLVPAIAMSRTPLAGRRRLFNTPRSVSEDPVFESTPDIDSKRQKRMSSVTEVMDSLRADDGQRRLSGLLMTANNSLPPSPSANDDFDIGIDPPSPWDEEPALALPPLGSPSETQPGTRRRPPKRKSVMDRRGRWGIEIDPAKVKARREWYLEESEFYMEKLRTDTLRRYKLGDIVSDRTSHYTWYVEATETQRNDPEIFEDFPEFPDNDLFEPQTVERPVLSVEEKLGDGKMSLQALLELEGKKSIKREIAKNFVDLLTSLSAGRAQVVKTGGLCFGPPSQTWVAAV